VQLIRIAYFPYAKREWTGFVRLYLKSERIGCKWKLKKFIEYRNENKKFISANA